MNQKSKVSKPKAKASTHKEVRLSFISMRMSNFERQAHYEYTKLKDCNVDHQGTFNFYGVVLEAQYPHKSFKTEKYICSLKIADPEQPLDQDGVIEHCTLVMFAKRFEDLPITQRVGDIIRVHRAYAGTFKGVKQFTANIFFNSSWALFSPLSLKSKPQN